MSIRWNIWGRACGIGAACFVIAVFFFCPRMVFWKGLGIPLASQSAEASRATDVLRQVNDPFIKIDNQTNQIIQWRLLLPMIGHYLHLPTVVFLAIPFVGGLAALGYVAKIMLDAGASLGVAFMGTLVSATSTWFFVSTGWLAYADSWLIFGLLIVAFCPSRIALAVTCLMVPWLDERIVMAVPVAGATRIVYFRTFFDAGARSLLLDAAVVAGLLIPYAGFRAYLLASLDESSTRYFEHHPKDVNTGIPLTRFLEGAWMGVRAGWIFVGLLVWLWVSKVRLWTSAFLVGSLLVTLLVGLTIAADIGRSSSTIAPAVVGGIVLALRVRPSLLKFTLPAAVGINLLSPAAHVITLGTIPIRYAYAEFDRFAEPPALVNPIYHLNQGVTRLNAGFPAQALQCFDAVIALDERSVLGRIQRALLLANRDNLTAAYADADFAVGIAPGDSNTWLVRGSVLLRQKQLDLAAQDLVRALALAPPNWEHRAECERLLAQAKAGDRSANPFRL